MLHLVFVLLMGAPQGPPPPPPPPPPSMPGVRDSKPDPKGTAVLKGHVRTADGRPLRRVQIRVTGGSLRNGSTTTTGIEGEYEVTELPAGRYTLHATRGGYLPAQYGQRRYGEPGTPVEIKEGGTVAKLDFALALAGVVSGRVTDETGEPVAGVDIRAMQFQQYQGSKRLVPVVTGTLVHVNTDDSGHYRLPNLPPGDYYIAGRLSETWMSDEKEPRMLSYAPSYFPGVSEVSQARRVRVASGQEAGATDFSLLPARTAAISGTAVGADGTPLSGARVLLTQQIMGPGGGSTFFPGNTTADAQGAWTLRDVTPGDYVLRANGRVGDGPTQAAVLSISVHGVDLTNLLLAADPGTVISGRVVSEGGNAFSASLTKPVVTVTPVSMADPGTSRPTPGVDDGVVGADGSFTRRAPSGPAVIKLLSAPFGWAVARVEVAGRDVTGVPVDLRPSQPISGVTVVLSNRLPALTGKVVDAGGNAADVNVLLLPADPARWLEAAGNQRTTRTDAAGTYRFDALRPGEYLVVTVESMQGWQMNDPEFLLEQQPRATKVTVSDSAPSLEMKLDLKVAR